MRNQSLCFYLTNASQYFFFNRAFELLPFLSIELLAKLVLKPIKFSLIDSFNIDLENRYNWLPLRVADLHSCIHNLLDDAWSSRPQHTVRPRGNTRTVILISPK